MKRIIIMAIGNMDTKLLRTVPSAVRDKFHIKAEFDREISIPVKGPVLP